MRGVHVHDLSVCNAPTVRKVVQTCTLLLDKTAPLALGPAVGERSSPKCITELCMLIITLSATRRLQN
ncbi:hypothetical protein J6590_069261 [Homalodisca vitripennis]|nr:hypothetical protein J6590_069261 [Homalodisca vitripennis]